MCRTGRLTTACHALASSMLGLALLGASCRADSQQAPTQGSQENTDALEQVVVTATRRSEDTQKVPVALAAVSTTQLENAGIQNFADLQNIVPSLAVAQAPGGFNFINIRGVGVGVATPFQSAGIPLTVDGMYLPHSENFIADPYFDINHVEVYRGPQGTFAGQNSTGGAIFVTAQQPNFTAFGGTVQQTVGNYNWFQTQAAVNLPINDQWAARIAINSEKRDGFTQNLGPDGGTGGYVDSFRAPGNLDKFDMRAILRFAPNDDVDFRLRFDYVDESNNGAADVNTGNLASNYTANGGVSQGSFNDPNDIPHPRQVSYDYAQYTDLRIDRLIFNTEWHINSGVELKTVTGYQDYVYLTGADADGGSPYSGALDDTGATQVATLNSTKDIYFTQEFDLVSTYNGPLQWVVGVDGLHQSTPIHTTVDVYGEGPQPGPPFPIPGLTVGPYGPGAPFGGIILNYYQQDKSYAGFGELKFNFTDQLQLIAGARYTYYEVEVDPPSNITGVTAPFAVVNECLSGPGPTGPGYPVPYSGAAGTGAPCNISGTAPYKEPTGRLVLNWAPTDTTTAYVSASRGFKQGGYVTQFDQGPGQHPGYSPEIVNDFELGVKTLVADHLRLDADAFYEIYDNYQAPFSVPNGAVPLTLNVQKARDYGAELQLVWSASDFRASLNATYVNTDITQDTTPAFVPTQEYGPFDPIPARAFTCTLLGITSNRCVTFTGEPIDYSPEWLANASVEYDLHVPGGVLTPRLQLSYIDSQWVSLFHASQDFIPSHATLDFRLAYKASEHWRVEAFVTNLTNRLYVTGVSAGSTEPWAGQVLLAPPRLEGARIQYSF